MRLHQNPFFILGASTRSDRQRIINLVEEKSLFLDPALCTRCGTELITPRSRLQCEMAWLPGVSAEQAAAIVESSVKGGVIEKLPSPLAQLNALVASTVQRTDQPRETLTGGLLEIARECERVDAEEIRALLNEDRRIAKFAAVDDVKEVERALADRVAAISAELAGVLRVRSARDCIAVMTQALERDTNGGTAPGSHLLHVLVDALAVDLEAMLDREKHKVDVAMQEVLEAAKAGDKAALDRAMEQLVSALTRWDRYAQPLQLSASSRGRQHESSKKMADAVRSLSVELYNEHDAYESTRRITELMGQVFAEDPRIIEAVRADTERLTELAAQRAEAEKRASILKDLEPIESAPTLRTFNTIGTALYGQRDRDQATSTYVATLYFVILFIPLIPLSAYRVRDGEKGGWYFLGKVPLTVGQRRYRRVVAIATALLIIYGLVTNSQQSRSYSYSADTPAPAMTPSPSVDGNAPVSSSPYTPSSQTGNQDILTETGLRSSRGTLRSWIDAERARITETETNLLSEQDRLESLESRLDQQKSVVESYEALAIDGSLPPTIYDQYESDLRRYNSLVDEYNSVLETHKWNVSLYQRALAAFNDSVNRYNGAR